MNTEGYTKLSASILTSTIWLESDQTVRVWFTLLAMCDKRGFVSGSVPGLASVARVSVDNCRTAIQTFLSPDPDSRTKDHEGRRLEEADGGWHVLNFMKYREQRDPDKRREQTRKAVAKHRQRTNESKPDVSQCKPEKAQAVNSKQKQKHNSKCSTAKSRCAGEKEFMVLVESVIGANGSANWGGRWRNLFRKTPDKARRAIETTRADLKEKQIDNPGGYAFDLYQRFA